MADTDPSQAGLLALHKALLAGDNAARVRLAELLLPALRRRFANRRELERDDIESIIGFSITAYLSAPGQYEPARAPLLAYLYRDVDGDIRNEARQADPAP
jgi:hypothetical protein